MGDVMNEVIYIIFIFIVGLYFGSLFTKIGCRLPNNKSSFNNKSICMNCGHILNTLETTPLLSYILLKGKCKHCNEKISIIYPLFEILTSILFVMCYLIFKNEYPRVINIIFSLLFISSLIIIMICDIKYMIIPNEILLLFGIILVILKMFIIYKLNISLTFIDMGYELLFIIFDGIIMFIIMYIIRLFGNLIFKTDSMGGGDIKMMSYISLIIGWKMSIVVIFLGSFFALPLSIIRMYTKKEKMLAFGPYLALSTIILFLLKINFETIIDLII